MCEKKDENDKKKSLCENIKKNSRKKKRKLQIRSICVQHDDSIDFKSLIDDIRVFGELQQ